jgi:hypothetical protein
LLSFIKFFFFSNILTLSPASNGTDLFICESVGGKISKMNINNGQFAIIDIATGIANPTDLFIQGNDVYAIDGNYSSLDEGKIFVVKNSVLGISEDSFFEEVLYPNPTSNFLMFNKTYNDLTYQILDVNGKQKLTGKLENGNKIDVSSIQSGLYLLQLENGFSTNFIKN